MKILPLVAFALLLAPAPWSRASVDRIADASSGKEPEPGDMVLFPLDDVSIPWRDNLKLTLEKPEKYPGNPVIRAGPVDGPDGYGATVYGTVIKQDGKFRMWYLANPRLDSRIPGDAKRMEYYRPVAYAESTDGIHWERPNLGLVEFRGSKNNNLVEVQPESEPYARSYDFIAVIFDPGDTDPARRYKMAYIGHDWPLKSGTTVTAVSPDGRRWKLANSTMFTKGHFENTSLIKFHGLCYVAGQNIPPHDAGLPDGSPAGRVMKVFFSPDFRHWSNGRALAFYRNDSDPESFKVKDHNFGQENHMGAGLWNRGSVVLGFYGRWHGDTIITDPPAPESPLKGLKMDLGLVISNDAIHYREPVRNFVMVPHGASEEWDSEAVLQGNTFANTETETYIWYSHWYTSRPNHIPPLPTKLSATMIKKADSVGLLRMPRDRFGSFTKLLPVSQERNPAYDVKRDASCLTCPLSLTQLSDLSVNLDDVSPGAALEIALVDDAEQPLAGYTAQLISNSLKAPVSWSGGARSLPVNRPFRVKITWPIAVDRARLYAIYIEHE